MLCEQNMIQPSASLQFTEDQNTTRVHFRKSAAMQNIFQIFNQLVNSCKLRSILKCHQVNKCLLLLILQHNTQSCSHDKQPHCKPGPILTEAGLLNLCGGRHEVYAKWRAAIRTPTALGMLEDFPLCSRIGTSPDRSQDVFLCVDEEIKISRIPLENEPPICRCEI